MVCQKVEMSFNGVHLDEENIPLFQSNITCCNDQFSVTLIFLPNCITMLNIYLKEYLPKTFLTLTIPKIVKNRTKKTKKSEYQYSYRYKKKQSKGPESVVNPEGHTSIES